MKTQLKRILTFLFILAFPLLLVFRVYAHPGKTDEYGGHYDRSTGEYHYHHGFEAHQHVDLNGDGTPDCPFEFVDKTGQNSGGSGYASSFVSSSAETKPPEYFTIVKEVVKENVVSVEVLPEWVNYALIGSGIVFLVMFIMIRAKSSDIRLLNSQLDRFRKELSDEKNKNLALQSENEALLNDNATMQLSIETVKTNSMLEIIKSNKLASDEIKQERERRVGLYNAILDNALIDRIKADLGEDYLLILSGGPPGTTFDDKGLPHKIENGFDIFLIPVSDSGKYHRNSCRYAKINKRIHAVLINKNSYKYSPCYICFPSVPDTDWIKKYHQYKKQLECSDIDWRDIIDEDS